MTIPIVEWFPGGNKIRAGKYARHGCFYKAALLNTLILLRPKLCLEIGTHFGGGVKVFQRYFDAYEPDGKLVTADVQGFARFADKRINAIRVYPHSEDLIERYKLLNEERLLPGWREKAADSVSENSAILLEASKGRKYDFVFVDGDHSKVGVRKDLDIIKQVVKWPHYALLSATVDSSHESHFLYKDELVYEYKHYDFEDWEKLTGVSLVWALDGPELQSLS